MPDSLLFIGVARQQGYSEEAAHAALAAVRARLDEAGVAVQRFYIFRTGDGGVGGGDPGPSEPAGRQRLLLAFQSADAALAFAQGAALGASPRLVALTISQLLAAMVQRPAIGALLVADEGEAPARPGQLPTGTRIERAALIELLAGVTP
jgi:hypothetical protein